MLSVINRGSIVGSNTDGLPFEIIDGNTPYFFEYLPTANIITSGMPTPLSVSIEPTFENGYLSHAETVILNSIDVLPISITPIIENGYTALTVNPTTR